MALNMKFDLVCFMKIKTIYIQIETMIMSKIFLAEIARNAEEN